MEDTAIIEVDGEQVPDVIVEAEGLPRLQWDTLQWWIDANVSRERAREAWTTAELQWLWHLGKALGSEYALFQSERSILLTRLKRAYGQAASRTIEKTLTTLDGILPGIVLDSSPGKHVIICLPDGADIRRYMACYGGDSGQWSGLCLHEGSVHVIIRSDGAVPELTLVHELTHACTSHLDLPRWLGEAMAQRMEHLVAMVPYASFPEKHRDYWKSRNLDEFWYGYAFEGNEAAVAASYSLAEHLLNEICMAKPQTLGQFIGNASRDDAGMSAAQEHLGCELSKFVVKLLDPVPPAPGPAVKFWRRLMGKK